MQEIPSLEGSGSLIRSAGDWFDSARFAARSRAAFVRPQIEVRHFPDASLLWTSRTLARVLNRDLLSRRSLRTANRISA